jgi:hypothetical protein
LENATDTGEFMEYRSMLLIFDKVLSNSEVLFQNKHVDMFIVLKKRA